MQKHKFISGILHKILEFIEFRNLRAFWPITQLEFCQIWSLYRNINRNIIFHFSCFQKKSKNVDITILDRFLAPFDQNLTNYVPYENRAPSDFSSHSILNSYKNSEKIILRKSVKRETDRQRRFSGTTMHGPNNRGIW